MTVHNWAELVLLTIALDLAQMLVGSLAFAAFAFLWTRRLCKPKSK